MTGRQPRHRVVDLHPDDAAARVRLRDELVAARYAAGLSRAALAVRLRSSKGNIQSMEERTYWSVGVIQRWARGLERRFTPRIDGLPPAPAAMRDKLHQALVDVARERAAAEGCPRRWAEVDHLERQLLVDALACTRIAQGMSTAQMAHVCGIGPSESWRGEVIVRNIDLAKVQRNARAVGFPLALITLPD